MKILKIELQNINSLKCETPITIDFESPRFEDVGLYAITGPTGSGKTTLLDAITIALYRKVPRFYKGNSSGSLEDVVSYGAASAMARITFEAQNQRYEAQWDMRTKGANGKLLGNPVEKVRLKNLTTEEIIAESKTSCDIKIVEITQLNYDQFLRSVMLAQGEFAAFLSAKNSEKGLLLQQIAGDEIYRKIGETLKNRISEEKKILEQIKYKINTDDLLSEEAATQLKHEEEQLNESLLSLNADLKKVETTLKWYEQLKKLEQQKEKNEINKQLLAKDIEENKIIFQQLEKHDAAEPLKESLTEIVRLEQEIEKKAKRINEIDSELFGLELKLNEAIATEKNSKAKVDAADHINKEWQPKLEKVIELDTTITTYKSSLVEKDIAKTEITTAKRLLNDAKEKKTAELKLRQQVQEQLQLYFNQHKIIPTIEKQLSQWNTKLTQRKSNSERIIALNKAIAQYKSDIQTNNDLLNKIGKDHKVEKEKIDELNASIKSVQELLNKSEIDNLLVQNNSLNTNKEQLRKLTQLSVSYNDLIANQKTLTEQKSSLTQKLQEISGEIKRFDAQLTTAKLLVQDAEELYEKEKYIASLEAERKKLKLGEPCALCGSTEHPFVIKYANIQISDSKKKLEERKAIFEKLNADKKRAELEQTKHTAYLTNLLAQIAKNKNESELTTQKFGELKSDHKIEATTELENAIKTLENEQLTLSKKITESHELQKLKDIKQADLKTVEENIKTFELRLTELTTAKLGLENSVLKSENERNELTSTNDGMERELAIQFADCALQLPETDDTARFIQQLERSITTYNENAKKRSETENAVENGKNNIASFTEQIATKEIELNTIEAQIQLINKEISQRNESRNTMLALGISTDQKRAELQQLIDTSRKELEQANKQLNGLKELETALKSERISTNKDHQESVQKRKEFVAILNDKISESRFTNRQEVSEALLSNELRTKYLHIRKAVNDKTIEISTIEKRIADELEIIHQANKPEDSFENSIIKQTHISEQREKLQKRKGEISESFRRDREIQSRNELIVKEIRAQEKVCLKWATLMGVLGGSQDAFNTYVQRLTLKNLIDLANLHLYKLNRRYSLQLNRQYKTGEELNFKLVDHYQADEMRLVDTSSGGEKFLISLALALGLSDLASYNVSIGSLFIDEGFGTLDSNTLETVISTLETLKAQGKMIGIISHVDSMKERIPLQIQVLKKSNGVSVVEIN